MPSQIQPSHPHWVLIINCAQALVVAHAHQELHFKSPHVYQIATTHVRMQMPSSIPSPAEEPAQLPLQGLQTSESRGDMLFQIA